MKRAIVIVAALALCVQLVMAMHEPLPGGGALRELVAANMAASGVEHPVTAVLLNFRGYDTLLEVAVLLLALMVILACGIDGATDRPRPANPLLQALSRLAAPSMIVVAVYLLWAGAIRPGGAFQAGAVLAAAAVLLHLTGVLPAWQPPAARLRWGLTGGLLLFLVVATMQLGHGTLLQYPPELAGALILLIETGLTISLGLTLAGLFLLLSRDPGDGA